MSRSRLEKRLSYRDQSGRGQAEHAAHWEGFTWRAGPVIVSSHASWGCVQVWAESEAEGKRVIRHAGVIAGVDPDSEPGAEWQVSRPRSSRYGRTGLMRTRGNVLGLFVTKRNGPSGAPSMEEATEPEESPDP
jgi:hypothetical protein